MNQDFRSIEDVWFLFPFNFDENNFEDLFNKVKDHKTARLIFNDNCETSSIKDYYYISNCDDKIKKLIVRLKNDDKKFCSGVSLNEYEEGQETYNIMKVNFDRIKREKKYNGFQNLYLRFRIKTPNLKAMMFCDLKKKNWFLESGFISTQIIDLKINKERNVPRDLCADAMLQKYKFIEFDKVHFLVMDQANNDVSILGDDFIECRKLENGEWNNYLNDEYNTEDILVYHWKMSKNQNNNTKIKEYGKLVKITTSTTNWLIIVIYIGIALVLGVFGNSIYDGIRFALGL